MMTNGTSKIVVIYAHFSGRFIFSKFNCINHLTFFNFVWKLMNQLSNSTVASVCKYRYAKNHFQPRRKVIGLLDCVRRPKFRHLQRLFYQATNISTQKSTDGSWNLCLQRVESPHLLLRDCIKWYRIDIQMIQLIGVHPRIYYEVRLKFICCCITKWFYPWQDVRENPFGIHSRVARVLVAV